MAKHSIVVSCQKCSIWVLLFCLMSAYVLHDQILLKNTMQILCRFFNHFCQQLSQRDTFRCLLNFPLAQSDPYEITTGLYKSLLLENRKDIKILTKGRKCYPFKVRDEISICIYINCGKIRGVYYFMRKLFKKPLTKEDRIVHFHTLSNFSTSMATLLLCSLCIILYTK